MTSEDGFDSTYHEEPRHLTAAQRAGYWGIASGLQAVDGLKPSAYLEELITAEINGKLDYRQIPQRLREYYEQRDQHGFAARQQEADFATARINDIYRSAGFELSVAELRNYHRMIFQDTMPDAGHYKQVALYKAEWILKGDTVNYLKPESVERMLDRAIDDESSVAWDDLSITAVINRITELTRRIWFVHPFAEGNTRAVATFIGKYLQSLGFDVTNDTFHKYSLYFRNALVRACYINVAKGVKPTDGFLRLFFENLLAGGAHELHNRDLVVEELAE
jgi:fido (protein-threonine AMPylation protein)